MEDDLNLMNINAEGGKTTIRCAGGSINEFYALLVQLFEESGAENFLTVEVQHDLKKFEISIVDKTGSITPAEKLEEFERIKEQLIDNYQKLGENLKTLFGDKCQFVFCDGYGQALLDMGIPEEEIEKTE